MAARAALARARVDHGPLSTETTLPRHSRRLFVALAGGCMFAPALLTTRKAAASPLRADALSFVHTHTGETLRVAFRA